MNKESEREEKKMNIYSKLIEIQNELKAPKGQYNSFGNYKYRSCEDILEAVKPICKKHKAVLIISDILHNEAERYYIEAIATLINAENPEEQIIVSAYAREEETKKGMDASQITGATSSYARKYALNGLFNIDDTKDTDTEEYQKQSQEEKPVVKATEKQIDILKEHCTDEEIDKIYEKYNIKDLSELSIETASKLISRKLGK